MSPGFISQSESFVSITWMDKGNQIADSSPLLGAKAIDKTRGKQWAQLKFAPSIGKIILFL
jgi:hypothetical protein